MRWRRWASRVCLAASIALGVTALTGFGLHAAGAATSDQTANRPFAYAGFGSTGAVFFQIDSQHGLEAFSQPIYSRFPDGLSKFTSTNDYARASIVYPGATFNSPSALACQLAGVFPSGFVPAPVATALCNVPKNPLSIAADDGNPDASVTGAPGIGTATAHADQDHARTDATFAGFDIGSLSGPQQDTLTGLARTIASLLNSPTLVNAFPPATGPVAIVHVASLESHTLQNFTSGGTTLVNQANSELSGIDILGGLFHIGSITVSTSAKADGQTAPNRVNHINVKDVTVAGQPASIGPDGITVGSTQIGQGAATAVSNALNGALKSMGFEIQLLGTSPSSVTDPTICRSGESDGVLIKDNIDLSNVPPSVFPTIPGVGRPFGPDVYYVHFVLGDACADASALLNPDTGSSNDVGGVTPVGSSGEGGGTPTALGLGGSTGGLGETGASNPVIATNTPHRRSTGHNGSRGNRTSGFLEADLRGLVADRVTLAYLAFTLAFLGVFLGFRPFLPSRLPGGP